MAKEQSEKKEKKVSNRGRNWAFLVYEDSAPDNWITLLQETHIPLLISPYHDKDKNPDGTNKKPHWHVVAKFEGVKSEKQVQRISDLISGVKVIQVESYVGYVRYLTHMDNPEKEQYSAKEITSLSGANYEMALESSLDIDSTLCDIEDFIDEHNIVSYKELCRYCRHHNREWYKIITSRRTLHITTYLKSFNWEIKQ